MKLSVVVKKKLSSSSGISCHAWNGAHNQIALCPGTPEVQVYEVDKQSGEYKLAGSLKEHEQLVSGVDWAPKRDMIVTCAHDRNAYVWERNSEGKVRRRRRTRTKFIPFHFHLMYSRQRHTEDCLSLPDDG